MLLNATFSDYFLHEVHRHLKDFFCKYIVYLNSCRQYMF